MLSIDATKTGALPPARNCAAHDDVDDPNPPRPRHATSAARLTGIGIIMRTPAGSQGGIGRAQRCSTACAAAFGSTSDVRYPVQILDFFSPHRGLSSELSSDAGLAARQLGFLIHPHHLSALRNESASPDLACSTERRHFPCALVLTPRLVSGCR